MQECQSGRRQTVEFFPGRLLASNHLSHSLKAWKFVGVEYWTECHGLGRDEGIPQMLPWARPRSAGTLVESLNDFVHLFLVVQGVRPEAVGCRCGSFHGPLQPGSGNRLNFHLMVGDKHKNSREQEHHKDEPNMAEKLAPVLRALFPSPFGFGPRGHVKILSHGKNERIFCATVTSGGRASGLSQIKTLKRGCFQAMRRRGGQLVYTIRATI